MSIREYIAYEGEKFTIEWFFTKDGKSPSLEYYNMLDRSQKIKLLMLFKRMGDLGKIIDKTKFNNEGDKIYAFKPQPDRFLCFFVQQQKIIITNGFCKKQSKLPHNEKERALNYKDDFDKRMKRGTYYE